MGGPVLGCFPFLDARLNPATRGASWRGVAWRGERRRRSARGPHLFSSSNSMRKRIPYKPLQLSFHFQDGTKLPTILSCHLHGPLEIKSEIVIWALGPSHISTIPHQISGAHFVLCSKRCFDISASQWRPIKVELHLDQVVTLLHN